MRILSLAALAAGCLWAGSASAESRDFACPDEAEAVVTHNGDVFWTATPQSSRLQSISIEDIAGAPAMVCHYRMFDRDYWIWRRPPEEVPNCTVWEQPIGDPRRGIFRCNDVGRR
jgi:hypothetical protein